MERILKLDGTFAAAAAIGAWIHTLRIPQGWSSDEVGDRAHALELARLALTHGRRDPDALAHGGDAIGFFGAVQEDPDAVERSLELNPNGGLCHDHAGWLRLYRGDAAGAIDAFNRAARLSSRDPMRFRVDGGLAWAHLIAGNLDAAAPSDRQRRALVALAILPPDLPSRPRLAPPVDARGKAQHCKREGPLPVSRYVPGEGAGRAPRSIRSPFFSAPSASSECPCTPKSSFGISSSRCLV